MIKDPADLERLSRQLQGDIAKHKKSLRFAMTRHPSRSAVQAIRVRARYFNGYGMF